MVIRATAGLLYWFCRQAGLVETITTLEAREPALAHPDQFALMQNYPNPFNPMTTIKYTVGGNRGVSLIVYDVLGRELAVLVNERKSSGNYEVTFDGSGLASGVYICRLTAGTFTQTRRMILLR
jgi:hypothetical protein